MLAQFFRRLWGLLSEQQVQIIELSSTRTGVLADRDAKASVSSLQAHPGFNYLLAKLAVQRASLESKLRSSRHASLPEVEFLQSGIFWTDWLASQLHHELYSTPQMTSGRDPDAEELSALRAMSTIKVLGAE